MNSNGSYEELISGGKRDVEDGTETPWGMVSVKQQPAVRIIDSQGKNWLFPMHWLDVGYEEGGSLVILFANGWKMTVEGDALFEPVHQSVIDYFRRQVVSLFRVKAPAVTRIVVEPQEEEKRR